MSNHAPSRNSAQVFGLLPLVVSFSILLLGALAFVALSVPTAHAAACAVTSSGDNGPGSLREKMGDSSCDTINFSGPTAITLGSTLSVTRTMTIDGLGQTVVISGNDSVRVFVIDTIAAFTATHLTISHGSDSSIGAGILMTSSTVNLSSVALENNAVTGSGVGGGIATSNGVMNIANSTFSNNTANVSGSSAGALENLFGIVHITNTTFVGNSAVLYGGAIYNNGTLTIDKSTFYNNSTSASSSLGGALMASGGSMTVVNSTFYYNQVSAVLSSGGGGIQLSSGTLNVVNSTFSNNRGNHGAGIHAPAGTANVTNTIMANGVFALGGGDCEGTLNANTNNLIEDGTCSPSLSGDPALGSLANNGGSTLTMALLPGSNAIDAGDDTTCNAAPINHLDQRNAFRPIGTHCDIGAYEAGYLFLPLVTK